MEQREISSSLRNSPALSSHSSPLASPSFAATLQLQDKISQGTSQHSLQKQELVMPSQNRVAPAHQLEPGQPLQLPNLPFYSPRSWKSSTFAAPRVQRSQLWGTKWETQGACCFTGCASSTASLAHGRNHDHKASSAAGPQHTEQRGCVYAR